MALPHDFASLVAPQRVSEFAAKTLPPAAVAGIGSQGMIGIGEECTGKGGVFCGTSTGKGGPSI